MDINEAIKLVREGKIKLAEPEMAETVAQLVNDRVESLLEGFIVKQTQKTDDIIDGRAGNVHGELHESIWEANLYFVLADGAKLEMRMQIKDGVSCLGNRFLQFPTTFHDAYATDGTKIWASEWGLKGPL